MRHAYDPRAAAEFARRQVDTANQVLVGHLNAGNGLCACGHLLPCSVALACSEIQRIHQGELDRLAAPLADTVVLRRVAIPEPSPVARHRRRRRLGLFSRVWPSSSKHTSAGHLRAAL
jgi:hypothetical protein